jgi:LPS export ABC transporter permease LptG/LPS export ABC transporter permease LptF
VRLLDRYIIREITPYALMGFVLLSSVIFLHEANRFSELFIVFSRTGQSLGPLFSLVASVIPGILVYTIPISLLLGTLMGLGRLSGDSEITAMRASGIGRLRLLAPLSFAGLVAASVMLYLTFELVPTGQQALGTLKESRGTLAFHGISTQLKPRVFEESIPGQILYIQDIDRHTGEWKNIFIAATPRENRQDETEKDAEPLIYTARAGRMTTPDGGRGGTFPELHLQEAQSHTARNINKRKHLQYDIDQSASLAIAFETAGREKAVVEEPTLPDVEAMRFATLAAYTPPDEQRIDYEVELHKRLAIPVSCLVFALIGLAFGVSNQRTGRSYGLLVGLLFTSLYYVLLLGGEQSARKGALPVWAGVWGPDILFAILGFVALFGRNTRARLTLPAIRIRRPRREGPAETSGTEASYSSWVTSIWIGFPRIVDRLVVRDLSRQFAFVTLGMTVVFLVFTLFELIGSIVENQISLAVVVGYIAYLSPQVVNYMAPLAVLVAVMVTFGMMASGSQIVALKASGQSVYRLAIPVFVLAALISGGLFVLENYVLPTSNRQQEDLRQQIKSGQEPARTVFQTDRRWFSGKESRIFNFKSYDRTKREFASFSVFDLDPANYQIVRRIYATRATWDAERQVWVLAFGWDLTFREGRVLVNDPFRTLDLSIAEGPDYFERVATDADNLDYGQLQRQISELSESGFDVLDLRLQLQQKIAFPLTCLVMALVGLPFAFSVGKRGALYGVAVGLAIGLVYWGALGLFNQMGRYEILPPIFAAWGPNLLFGATGAYLFLRTRT